MYNEQLEKLIEMALIDGELTEKEKQILRILCQNEIVTLEADDDSQEKKESKMKVAKFLFLQKLRF